MLQTQIQTTKYGHNETKSIKNKLRSYIDFLLIYTLWYEFSNDFDAQSDFCSGYLQKEATVIPIILPFVYHGFTHFTVHLRISSFFFAVHPFFDESSLNGQRSETIHNKRKVVQLKRQQFLSLDSQSIWLTICISAQCACNESVKRTELSSCMLSTEHIGIIISETWNFLYIFQGNYGSVSGSQSSFDRARSGVMVQISERNNFSILPVFQKLSNQCFNENIRRFFDVWNVGQAYNQK